MRHCRVQYFWNNSSFSVGVKTLGEGPSQLESSKNFDDAVVVLIQGYRGVQVGDRNII